MAEIFNILTLEEERKKKEVIEFYIIIIIVYIFLKVYIHKCNHFRQCCSCVLCTFYTFSMNMSAIPNLYYNILFVLCFCKTSKYIK